MRRLGEDERLTRIVRERLAGARPKRKRARELVAPVSLWRWAPLVLGVIGGLTIVTAGTAAVDHWTSPRVNEPCERHRDCASGEFCMLNLPHGSRYCSTGCEVDRECPKKMHCGDIAELDEADRGVGAVGPAGTSSACVR
jgi:hypothetical protein